MEPWEVALAANGVVSLAYFAICRAILVPLARAGELGANKLGTATAAIFFTCAVHHGAHAVHMTLPSFGVDVAEGLATRQAFSSWMAAWDVVSAATGLYYWSLRRGYGRLLLGAKLFEDHKERQREALEINDTIVQGLVTAQVALAAGRPDEVGRALDATLARAREVVDRLMADAAEGRGVQPGDFVRQDAARLGR